MAKQPPDPDRRPRPSTGGGKKRSKDDPPPVRLRPGEEEDDEEYDLRPKAQRSGMAEYDSRGRKVNQRRKRLWQNISTFLTLAVVLSIFGVGIYLLLWARKPVPPDPHLMAFVPARTTYIYGVNMMEARYNEKFRQKMDGNLERAVPPYMMSVMNQLKLRLGDLKEVIIAADSYIPALAIQQPRGNVEFGNSFGVVAALKLQRTAWQSKDERDRNEETVDIQFSKSELQSLTQSEERYHNGKSYFAARSPDGTPFFYHGASARVLVITESERCLRELLDKPDSVIAVTGPIRDIADRLGGENFWYGMTLAGAGGDYDSLTDPIGFGGKVIKSQSGGEIGFGFGGGVYNHGVDFTNLTYLGDPSQARAMKEFAEELNKAAKEILKSLSNLPADTMSLEAKFKLDEISNAKFEASGGMFTYTTRFRTSTWEEILENGVKVGSQVIRVPFPFFKGPFGGLASSPLGFGGGAPPVGGGSGMIWGPGGGIVIGGP